VIAPAGSPAAGVQLHIEVARRFAELSAAHD
jgi:hypothetical protein